jgi:hypothetical protein
MVKGILPISLPKLQLESEFGKVKVAQAPLASADKNNIRVKRFKSNIIMPLFLKR